MPKRYHSPGLVTWGDVFEITAAFNFSNNADILRSGGNTTSSATGSMNACLDFFGNKIPATLKAQGDLPNPNCRL